MKYKWTKNTDSNYSFWIDGNEAGFFDIRHNSMVGNAAFTFGGETYEIKRTGFWKSRMEITGGNQIALLSVYPEQWYANNSVISYESREYKLVLRNNPMAEYVITGDNNEILAYALASQQHELKVRISESGNAPAIFHFLLWYLFLPVASENFAENFLFFVS